MLGDEVDFNATPEAPAPEPSEKNNKTFIILASVLGGLVLLSMICVAVLVFYIAPKTNATKKAEQATREFQNAQVVAAMTATSEASLWTPTALPSPKPSETPAPTDTPVVAIATNTVTVLSAQDIQTATMAALNTQVARAQLTPTSALAGTANAVAGTSLPQSGFADEVGLPGIVILGILLIAVILLARRLRMAPTR